MTPRTRGREAAPRGLVGMAVLGSLIFVLPVLALLLRAPWGDLAALWRSDVVVDALRVSLVSSVLATVVVVVLGVPLAWVLARLEFPGRRVARAVVTLPMVLPPVVGGATLLFAFGRRGLIGEPLESATGVLLPFSLWGVVVANVFVAMPFLVVTVEGALTTADRSYEQAAASLGAGRWTIFRRITLPMTAIIAVLGKESFMTAWIGPGCPRKA